MPERIKNILDMLGTIGKFDDANKADYQQFPAIAAQYAIIRTAIAVINAQLIKRASSEKSRHVEQKSVLRLAVWRKMKDFARTARGINMNDAGFQELFRLPEGDNDQILITKSRQFIAKGNEYGSAFFALGIPQTLADDLEEDTNALEQANDDKTSAELEDIGATAEVDNQVDLVMKAAKILDIAMKNVYRNDPAKLAEWTSARHIRRKSSSPLQTPPAES